MKAAMMFGMALAMMVAMGTAENQKPKTRKPGKPENQENQGQTAFFFLTIAPVRGMVRTTIGTQYMKLVSRNSGANAGAQRSQEVQIVVISCPCRSACSA